MEDILENRRPQRKRRRIGRRQEADEAYEEKIPRDTTTSSTPAYNFLHLVCLILEYNLPILFPGSERPRNAFALIGTGGSFLAFKEERTMDDVVIDSDQLRSLEKGIILKRTRQHHEWLYPGINGDTSRYMSIMSELQILVDPAVQAHENFIDLHGLTWDFEPEDDGSSSVWPVLGLEAAECSLRSLMSEYNESGAPLLTRIGYCYNVAVALCFLHGRGVVHCDVKLENVLVCVTQRSGSVGKLSDFGSIVLGVNEGTLLPNGVAGTPPWNAPEYRKPLSGLDIFKVDVYSFGMLLWRFLARSPTLESLERADGKAREKLIQNLEALKMSDELACVAIEELKGSYDPSYELDSMIEILKKTLAPLAEQRCSMVDVCSLMSQWTEATDESEESVDDAQEMQGEAKDLVADVHLRDDPIIHEENSAKSADFIYPISLEHFLIDLEMFYVRFEDESPLVKAQLVSSLRLCAESEQESTLAAGYASYHLAVCYVNEFGVQRDFSQAWQWMMKSAQLQNPLARGQAYRLHQALFPNQNLLPETKKLMLGWLQETVLLGSSAAARDLHGLDPTLHKKAIRLWEKRFCQIGLEYEPKAAHPDELTRLDQMLSSLMPNEPIANSRGHQQIHMAVSLGDIELLGKLLRCGVNIDSRNAQKETPLLCACRANEPKAAIFLLEHGASIDPAASGESPLHWIIALDGPHIGEVAKKLVQRGANLEQQHTETENNDLTFDIYPHGTPIDWAVSKRCISAVKTLVELGADPFNECSQFSAFTRAISAHDWEVVHVLLTSRHATQTKVCALDSTGHSLLFEAIYCYPQYERFLIHGPGIGQAAIKTIKTLLEAGCDPSCVDDNGSSVMHILSGYCSSDFIEMVLKECDFKKYIDRKSGSLGQTPIHHALAAGNIKVLKLLVEYGADTYVETSGRSILHLLAGSEDEDFALRCLEALEPDSRSDLDNVVKRKEWPDGLTAFELAVHSSHLKIAEYLVASGASNAARNPRDWHFLASLISSPSWDSLQALQYYLDRVESPFIVKEATSYSVLHVAASMTHYLADSITGEQKLDILLSRFSQYEQVNAITKSSDDPSPVSRQTPLHHAAESGVFYAVSKLLRAGANPNLKDENSDTPIDLARKRLAYIRERVMEHEEFRVVEELKSIVRLLEQPQNLDPGPSINIDITQTHMWTRFSMLGFQTQSSGQDE